MNNKTVGGLVVAALLLAAGAAVVVSRSGDRAGSSSAAAAANGELLLPKAREQLGKIAKVRLKRGAVETVLESKEQDGKPQWVVASKHAYPAESERVRKLIGEVLDARIVETKTAKPELYDRIGVGEVDKPGAAGALIELSNAQGQPLGSVIIGNASSAPSGEDPALARPRYFVRRSGEPQSYLAAGNLVITPEPMSWVTRSAFDLDLQRVRSATITHKAAHATPETPPADQIVSVSKALPADPAFKLDNLPEGRALKDEYAPMRVAQALTGVTIDDVAPASTIDMSSPELTAQARTFDGLIITASAVTKDGKRWWSIKAAHEDPAQPPADDAAKAAIEAAKTKAAQINQRHAAWVYILPDYKVTNLTTKLEDVLKPIEPPPAPTPETAPLPPAPTSPTPPAPAPTTPPQPTPTETPAPAPAPQQQPE